jgi:hydroxypyruvate isomerase
VRFSVNTSTLFTDVPLLQRFGLAAAAGFAAVECWWPDGVDPERFVEAVRTSGLRLVLLNFYGGDLSGGDRGVLADPERARAFRQSVPLALDIASALGCRHLHALVGIEDMRRAREAQLELALQNVRWAAKQAARHGAWVLIEPINPFDNGRYLLPDISAAADFVRAVGADNLGLQFDTYHLRRSGQPLEAALATHADLIRHVQVADAPGRGAPGTGKIDFAAFFTTLDQVGYDGYVGLEYLARSSVERSLQWLPTVMRRGDHATEEVVAAMRAHR